MKMYCCGEVMRISSDCTFSLYMQSHFPLQACQELQNVVRIVWCAELAELKLSGSDCLPIQA